MVTEIVALVIDIALGAIAYRLARQAELDVASLRAEVSGLRERVEKLESED